MHAPVDPVDDSERRAPELIIEPASDETADHGFAMAFALERPGRWRAGCAILRQAPVQPLDDIPAFPQRTQTLLYVGGQNPTPGPGRLSQSQPFERPHSTNPDLPQRVVPSIALGAKIDDPFRPFCFPVEPCPAFG